MSISSSRSSSINIPKSSQSSVKSYFATILPFLKSDIRNMFVALDSLHFSSNTTTELLQLKIVEHLKPGSALLNSLEEFYISASMLGNPLSATTIPHWLKTPVSDLENLVKAVELLLAVRNFDTEYDVSNLLAKLFKNKNYLLDYLSRNNNNLSASNSENNSRNSPKRNNNNNAPFPFENMEPPTGKSKSRKQKQRKKSRKLLRR